MQQNNYQHGGIGLGGLLLCVFITLKLCKIITWTWVWVLAPLWIPAGLFLALLLVVLLIMGIGYLWCAKR